MPKLVSETIGTGDQSWLAKSGPYKARTETIDISSFTANTHYPKGYIPSGTPVALVGGLLVPYDKTEGTTTNAGILAGFLLTDQPVVGTNDFGAPLVDSGRVHVAKIPYYGNTFAFATPAAAAKRAATTFVFIG